MAGFTIYYSLKEVKNYKEQKQYKEALDYLEGIIEKHCAKKGFQAWFRNERPIVNALAELKRLRAAQCIEKAGALINSNECTLYGCEEAMRLLDEAQGYHDRSEARLLIGQAKQKLDALSAYQKAKTAVRQKLLTSALKFLLPIDELIPAADALKADIEKQLAECGRLYDQAVGEVREEQFTPARMIIEQILNINKEYEGGEKLKEQIRQKERARNLMAEARRKQGSDQKEVLYSALNDLVQAAKADPDHGDIAGLAASIKERIIDLAFAEGIRLRDTEKDILGALAAFEESVAQDVKNDKTTLSAQNLETLRGIAAQIEAAYASGISAGNDLQAGLDALEKAAGFGFRYKDLDRQTARCREALARCHALLSDAEHLLAASVPDADRAVAGLQEALVLFPGFQPAQVLLDKARHCKKVQDALRKVEQTLSQSDFQYTQALAAHTALLQLEPDHPEAADLKRQIVTATNRWLASELDRLVGARRLTEALRQAKEVQAGVSLDPDLIHRIGALAEEETAARKLYQDGFKKLDEARNCPVQDEDKRGGLYREAGRLLAQSVDANADLRNIVEPELEALKEEHEEWRAYLLALKSFEADDYGTSIEMLRPYQANPRLKETRELMKDALNRMGFSGPFSIIVDNITYTVLPQKSINVGRNTSSYQENQITLNLQDVSRKHGMLTRNGKQYYYKNRQGCHHGTRLNRTAIDRKVALKTGDRLEFGYFKEDDGSPADDEPAAVLSVALLPPADHPSLKMMVEPQDHADFCEAAGRTYLLIGGQISIGRSKNSAIRLSDRSVAPQHAAVTLEQDRYWIEDLNTPGGTFVNGEPLDQKRPLNLGDRIRIGRLEMQIEP